MYSLLRPLLFSLDAEKAHHLSLSFLDYLPRYCFKSPCPHPVKAMGLEFSHPLGLAAGLDKNGKHIKGLSKLGFSFIELGTVTPRPQAGNPKPRLFRLPDAEAIINRMGFNNEGVEAMISHLKKASYEGITGINIGKNKDTPLHCAVDDYLYCLERVYAYASYITINISSPNTPDLRLLQQQQFLNDLLDQLIEAQMRLSERYQRHVPLVVKLSPDEPEEELKQMADLIATKGISGIIATNTTCSRQGINNQPHGHETGGLSGKPLASQANACLRILKKIVGNQVTLIGVGGIDSIEAARERLESGADLLQIYTGLIYKGPNLIHDITSQLSSCI